MRVDLEQTISIYRNRKSGAFRIQPFGRLQNGSSQAFGEQERLPAEIDDAELLRSICDNLEKNDRQTYNRHHAPKASQEEWRRELKEDQLISVYRLQSEYRLVPSRRKGNGYESIDEMISLVPRDEFLRRGGAIVRDLFDQIP